jgi:SAM-dependent methyltransferase
VPDARVAEGNTDMDTAWNGVEGVTWATFQDCYDAAVLPYHFHLLAAAAVATGDRVLDVGCGCGQTTRDAARAAPSGSALGVDLSGPMLERAQQLATDEGLENVEFAQGDAQVFRFASGSFDVVTSRFGVMFFSDPTAAFENVAAAARPGARLAFLSWLPLEENEWLLEIRRSLAMGRDLPAPMVGAPGPFGLADPDMTRTLLHDTGFADVDCTEVRESLVVGTDADDAFGFVSQMAPVVGLLNDLDNAARATALEQLHASLVAHTDGTRVGFGSAAWLVTARRA